MTQQEVQDAYNRVKRAYNDLTLMHLDPALEDQAGLIIGKALFEPLNTTDIQKVLHIDRAISQAK